MTATIPRSVTVRGVAYQFEAEAEAGLELGTGKRWWGTRVKYRPGTRGRWRSVLLIDVHPFAAGEVERGLFAWLERLGRG
jgi:hypothetical protein